MGTLTHAVTLALARGPEIPTVATVEADWWMPVVAGGAAALLVALTVAGIRWIARMAARKAKKR
jgi:hypothetical protein